MTKAKIVLDDLADDEAWARAQMCKRMIWDDFRRLSVGIAERNDMDSATIKLRRALAEAGVDSRNRKAAVIAKAKASRPPSGFFVEIQRPSKLVCLKVRCCLNSGRQSEGRTRVAVGP